MFNIPGSVLARAQQTMKPNILFVMADQFRLDALGSLSNWMRTPHLDRICAEGVIFSNVFANSVECIPSRFSLAAGLYPHQTGIWTNCECTLSPTFPNWMKLLEKQGYETSLFGKTHLHPHAGDLRDREYLLNAYGLQIVDETTGPRASAYVRSNMTDAWQAAGLLDKYRADMADRFTTKPYVVRPSPLPLSHYYDVYTGQAACRHLETRRQKAPWFCWVSFGGPHEPWDAPEPYASMYPLSEVPNPIPRTKSPANPGGLLNRAFNSREHSPPLTPTDALEMRANYAGKVSLIDNQVGQLIKIVEDRGELANTLIIFTSDHGEMNGDHGLIYKSNFLDPAVKVPLIVRPPASANDATMMPRVVNALVELMDVGATIIDYSEADYPPLSHAKSFRSLIEDPTGAFRNFTVSEFANYYAIVTERWKAEFNSQMKPTLLVDRKFDHLEQNDRSEESAMRPILQELEATLASFLETTPRRTQAVQ